MKKKIVKKTHADPTQSALSFKAIRNEYADLGVENYYRNHGNVYENPHFPYIQELLEQNKHRIDYSHTLDLACGGGEVALILRGVGFDNSVGCDPFTHALFEQNTGRKCLTYSFDDIIKGVHFSPPPQRGATPATQDVSQSHNLIIPQSHNHIITQSHNHIITQSPIFSSVISSFAMHLCPEKQLFPLVSQLFLVTKNIVIITPHKRPELEKLSNVTLLFEDFVLTERGKKVFLKSYLEK